MVRRRTALGADLGLDFTDIPVYPAYVFALTRCGDSRVHRQSRWLNAVSITSSAEAAPRAFPVFLRASCPAGPDKRMRPIEPLRDLPDSHREGVYQPLGAAPGPVDSLELAFYGGSYQQLDQIQALALHRLGYTGAGVRVMMLDTGFRKDHPVFDCTNLIAEWDFVNEDGNTQNEGGDHGSQHNHGTGVWGVTGGYQPGSLIGPAFGAEFLLAKTEDLVREVHAEEDNYVAALEWGDSMGVDVTSASLGLLHL